MEKSLLPVLLLLFVFMESSAQLQFKGEDKIRTLTLNDTIVSVAIDRTGDFYSITDSGQIQRFDKDGARIFLYYRDQQHYEFRNPSFEAISSFKIDPAFAIRPWLICPSGEYKLWVLDSADQSLKKIDVRASEVEVEIVVDPALIENAASFTTMREYQNFVFLLNPDKGIYVFNSMGRHIKTIAAPGVQRFNFLGEELYYLRKDKLEFFNLFTTGTRQLPIATGYSDALLTDERLILFKPLTIDIFSFRP